MSKEVYGVNELHLNQAQMCAIVQEWIQYKFDGIVSNVSRNVTSGMFVVTISEKPPVSNGAK